MTDKQQRAYNWITNTMILDKPYKVTDDQIEVIKTIWNEIHSEGYWYSFNETSLTKFKI